MKKGIIDVLVTAAGIIIVLISMDDPRYTVKFEGVTYSNEASSQTSNGLSVEFRNKSYPNDSILINPYHSIKVSKIKKKTAARISLLNGRKNVKIYKLDLDKGRFAWLEKGAIKYDSFHIFEDRAFTVVLRSVGKSSGGKMGEFFTSRPKKSVAEQLSKLEPVGSGLFKYISYYSVPKATLLLYIVLSAVVVFAVLFFVISFIMGKMKRKMKRLEGCLDKDIKSIVKSKTLFLGGEILDENDHRYTSTSVSGHATADSYSVSSSVHHHQDQKLWYKKPNGAEETVTLYNKDFDVRVGHKLGLLYDANGDLHRVINRTGEFYQRIGDYRFGSYKLPFFSRLGMMIFIAIPVINTLMALFGLVKSKAAEDAFGRGRVAERSIAFRIFLASLIIPMFYAAFEYNLTPDIVLKTGLAFGMLIPMYLMLKFFKANAQFNRTVSDSLDEKAKEFTNAKRIVGVQDEVIWDNPERKGDAPVILLSGL